MNYLSIIILYNYKFLKQLIINLSLV